ncbi:MAG: 23S rRNA (uracil(1939)-C(5))-methyltransferase RlmD [Lachnospiraceae bacterium]
MKKGQIYQGVVERVEFPNKGIVVVEGKSVVVKNALPGQTVQFRINKLRSGKAEGALLEVLVRSDKEVAPACSHFGLCGGCTYLSLPYEEHLSIKEEQVKSLLDGVLKRQENPYTWEGIKPSPSPYEYRNKMEFSFGDTYKDGPMALGMHKRGSFYDIVTVDTCKIVDGDYRAILSAVLRFFEDSGIPYHHRMKHEGILRHLLVRKAVKTGEILLALVTTSELKARPEVLEAFKEMLLGLSLEGRFAGILHINNDSLADIVQSDETTILYGQDFFYEELLGLRFKISTFSFFQTNSLCAEVLYETAREYIGDLGKGEKIVYDLYSGTGTIAQLMAPIAKKVIGVEIVEEAVVAAGENAALNGLTNCEFIAGDVLKALDDIEEMPDFIILDPPRDGIHPKAIRKILDYQVENMIYVSCKPTSLARDLEVFLEAGYEVKRACCVDQFPWTANVETLVCLSKLNVDHHIEVELNMDGLDV